MLNSVDLENALRKRDLGKIKNWARESQAIIRKLASRIYINDGLMFWRAVEALGVAAKAAEETKPGSSVELCRRYFWSLNEESGGTCWNASHAIGSIMAQSPKQCGHFNWMFCGLLEDSSLQEGVLWGLIQIAQKAPGLVDPLEEEIRPYLTHEEEKIRGLANLVYLLMGHSSGMSLNWQISKRSKEENIVHKGLEIYQNGRIHHLDWTELTTAKSVIRYWTEKLELKRKKADDEESRVIDLTVAQMEEGICWMSLGHQEEEEAHLREWATRWYPKFFLIKDEDGTSQARIQMKEYLSGKRRQFELKLAPTGTPFQRRVWEELLQIPYGETRSYEDIAKAVNSPKGQRAVGMANHNNAIIVVIPCHRVIGKNGSLTGYGGGLELKRFLLELEEIEG